jgi:translation initiation factor SUI1
MNIDFNKIDSTTKVINENTTDDKVHIRVFKRSAKKYITIVEGLDKSLDFKGILRKLRKNVLFCNGKVVNNKETEIQTLKLQGDHQEKLIDFFTDELSIKKDNIVVHGGTGY